MLLVVAFCIALLIFTTVIHYEVLRALTLGLPAFNIPPRTKLIAVILVMFLAHALEILLYALTVYLLIRYRGFGGLAETSKFSFNVCFYFSAETYTSLGYGDIVPSGNLRLLVGVEALNGLLLIGWSASYTYIAMERFWNQSEGSRP